MKRADLDKLLQDCVGFTQRLIQTPSMPKQESAIAKLILDEMESLGIDDVWIDDIGNVCGRIRGDDPALGALVLNSHIDHVDPGPHELWPVPPYSAEIVEGRIHGRGACDVKGPLAVQVYSMAALLQSGERPRRDIVFTGVVQEEIGGAGAAFWVEKLNYPVELIVLGEPTANNLGLGHRGILQLWVTFSGRSVHASVPSSGVNHNYYLGQFLRRPQEQQGTLREHPMLGPTTVAPTVIEVDTTSLNVTPAWTRVLLDFRTATESVSSLKRFIRRLADEFPCEISDAWAEEHVDSMHAEDELIYGYYTPPDSEVTRRVRAAVAKGMGREPSLTSYQFATDGRHFVPHGIPVVGYSPGEESLAHTVQESISIAMMRTGLQGYIQLLHDY